MNLAAMAATFAIALPFGGVGVTATRVEDPNVCGAAANGTPNAACVNIRQPRYIYCHSYSCSDRWVIAHELGHVLDFGYMKDWHRWRFADLYYGKRYSSYHDEIFAEAFAACATMIPATGYYYKAVLDPRSRRGQRICKSIGNWSNASKKAAYGGVDKHANHR